MVIRFNDDLRLPFGRRGNRDRECAVVGILRVHALPRADRHLYHCQSEIEHTSAHLYVRGVRACIRCRSEDGELGRCGVDKNLEGHISVRRVRGQNVEAVAGDRRRGRVRRCVERERDLARGLDFDPRRTAEQRDL